MKVYCKTCNQPVTRELKLYTGKSFGEADEQPFIQQGFYAISYGEFFTNTEGYVIGNIQDLQNTRPHTDRSRLEGCCGLDGLGGVNTLCLNGHEVATEKSDCWMPFAVIFERQKIILK